MSVASIISSAAPETLLVAIDVGIRIASGRLGDSAPRQQNGGMRLLQHADEHIVRQGREQVAVVKPKAAYQGTRARQLYQLRGRQLKDYFGYVFSESDTETKSEDTTSQINTQMPLPY